MVTCLIAIGSNIGDCPAHIEAALKRIGSLPETRIVATSTPIQTNPVGTANQVFLNGAVLIETDRPVDQLMQDLLAIEAKGGRDRLKSPGNRPIDLDILLYGNEIIATQDLQIPHPRMTFRRFVLEPACEIAPDLVHPVTHCSLAQLLHHLRFQRNIIVVHCDHPDEVKRFEAEWPQWNSGNDTDTSAAWCFANQSPEVLSSLRKTLVQQNTWWVWLKCDTGGDLECSQSKKHLARVSGAAKLNVYLNSASFKTTAPYWCLAPNSPQELFSNVSTAIQSMMPLHGNR